MSNVDVMLGTYSKEKNPIIQATKVHHVYTETKLLDEGIYKENFPGWLSPRVFFVQKPRSG